METETRQELEATVAARRELGPEHDEHLIAGFLKRIESEIDRRVDERVARGRGTGARFGEKEIGAFVGIFLVAGIFGGATGIMAAAAALALVFLVQTLRG